MLLGTGDIIVQNCTFTNGNTAAIHLSQLSELDGSGTSIIRDNEMHHTNQEASRGKHSEGVITISIKNWNLVILRNHVHDAPVAFLSKFRPNMCRWLVADNLIQRTNGLFWGREWTDHNPGGEPIPLQDITWTNNRAENVGKGTLFKFKPGMLVRWDMYNNRIIGGYLVLDGIRDSSIRSNIIHSCGQPPLTVTNTRNMDISDNELRDTCS